MKSIALAPWVDWGCYLLVGISLVLATNFVDSSGALAGVLGVVGMMIITTGVLSNLSLVFAKKEKVPNFEPESNLISVRSSGVSKCVADSAVNLGWKSVEKITLTEFGIGFATKEGGWFIPISALGSATTMKTEVRKDRIRHEVEPVR